MCNRQDFINFKLTTKYKDARNAYTKLIHQNKVITYPSRIKYVDCLNKNITRSMTCLFQVTDAIKS